MAGGAILFVWLLGLFSIVAVICWKLFQFITRDSIRYDEEYVWLRTVNKDHKSQ
ncbi:hypothetical protein [Paenibacillus marinisediminis]